MTIPWTPEEEEIFTWKEIKESYKDFFKKEEKNNDQEESRKEEQKTKQGAV